MSAETKELKKLARQQAEADIQAYVEENSRQTSQIYSLPTLLQFEANLKEAQLIVS